jgi:hypothetical protein
MQDVIKHSQKKTKKLKTIMSGHQELAAKEKRISEELTKNIYLQRDVAPQKWSPQSREGQLRAPGTTQGTKKGAPRQALSSLEYFHLTTYLGF